MVLRNYRHTDDSLRIVHRMLDNPALRSSVLASRHVNPLLVDLLHAGRAPDAAALFERVLALDSRFRQSRPNAKTFNIMIHYNAKAGDREGVRRLMARMPDAGIKPDASTMAAIPMLHTSRLAAAATGGGAEVSGGGEGDPSTAGAAACPTCAAPAGADEEAEVDAVFERSVEAASASAAVAVGRNTFNQFMQSYFRLGKPVKALRVLQGMAAVGAVPGPDTFRTLLHGLILAGGPAVTGTPLSRIPATWGGTMPASQYDDERRAATVLRARVAAGSVAGQQPSASVSRSQAAGLRLAGVGSALADWRLAVWAAAATAPDGASGGSGGDLTAPLPPALLARLGVEWLGGEAGQNLIAQLAAFDPWPRDATARAARLAAKRAEEHSIAGALGDVDALPFLPSTRAAAALLPEDDAALVAEGRALQRAGAAAAAASSSSGDDGGDDDDDGGGSGGDEAGDGGTGARSSRRRAAITATTTDLLPLFPRVLRWLVHLGMPPRELHRLGDVALSWSTTFTAAPRALQTFATLYNLCLWEDKLVVGSRAAALVPGLTTVDLRRVHVATASVFLHLYTSHLALRHLLRRPAPATSGDIAFLVGIKPGRLHAQMEELMAADLLPPLHAVSTERALICRAPQLQAWLARETERVAAAATAAGLPTSSLPTAVTATAGEPAAATPFDAIPGTTTPLSREWLVAGAAAAAAAKAASGAGGAVAPRRPTSNRPLAAPRGGGSSTQRDSGAAASPTMA